MFPSKSFTSYTNWKVDFLENEVSDEKIFSEHFFLVLHGITLCVIILQFPTHLIYQLFIFISTITAITYYCHEYVKRR